MYRYQIQKGAENRSFAGDGVRNLGNGTIESDHELTSQYLTLVKDEQPQAPPAPPQNAPTAPAPPQTPPAQSAPVQTPPQNTQQGDN